MAESFNEAVQGFTDDLARLLISKRLDYGAGNLAEFGTFGVLVRVSDKFHRLKNLQAAGATPNHEAIRDTWQDIAGYAILALMIEDRGIEAYTALEAVRPPSKARIPKADPMPVDEYVTAVLADMDTPVYPAPVSVSE